MLPAFFVQNQNALLFYAGLILLIVLLRKKLDWQTFGIGLYRTKFGLKLMNTLGKKYTGLVQLLAYIGVGVGFIGMALIVWLLTKGFIDMFFNPAAPPVVSPVIPGFSIWGYDLKVPLITGWLALFVVIVIHEFSHGVVSIAHKVRVKSSGLLVFGPIAGAFVEPDEKQLVKTDPIVQYSLFAAGPWSNILSAGLFMLIIGFILTPLILSMTVPGGIEVVTVLEGYPAAGVLVPGMVITGLNGQDVRTHEDMETILMEMTPGDELAVMTDAGEHALTTIENPDVAGKAYMGVTLQKKLVPKHNTPVYEGALRVLYWFQEFLKWVYILSLGIGLANLLPIGPVDGGRMFQMAARQVTGSDKRGDWWWKKVTVVTLAILVVLLLVPLGRMIF